jgi:hypothetical protein
MPNSQSVTKSQSMLKAELLDETADFEARRRPHSRAQQSVLTSFTCSTDRQPAAVR